MAIQFDCGNCGQVLKVPDGNAGKKAKCPKCQATVDIPASPVSDIFDASPFAAESDAAMPPPPSAGQSPNPFESPLVTQTAHEGPLADLHHNIIDFSNVLDQTMLRYKQQMAMGALFALVLFGVAIGSSILNQILGLVFGVFGNALGGAASVAMVVIMVILIYAIQFFVQAFNQSLSNRFGLNVARSREPFEGIFAFQSVPPIALAFLVFTLLGIGAALIAAAPVGIGMMIDSQGPPAAIGIGITILLAITLAVFAVILVFRFFLFVFFIVDRRASIVEALRLSTAHMKGNKVSTFLLLLVVGLIGSLFVLVTCGIGMFFYIPYLQTLTAVIYLKSTGQYQDIAKA